MLNEDIVILFVDDEVSTLHALERYLLNEPFSLLFAQSGKQALEIMIKQSVHILVTDMKMPEMDGLELLKTVKIKFPATIRLVLSGYSRLSSIIPAINSGEIYRYITKPIEPEIFKKTLWNAVDFYLINQDKKKLLKHLKKRNQELSIAIKEKEDTQKELDYAQSRIEKTLLQGRSHKRNDHIDLAVLNRSAKNIAGDFHDIINLAPSRLDILLGDVMGKGILAALVGAGTKQCFLKVLGERYEDTSTAPLSPSRLTQRVQQMLTPGLFELESFVTTIYARIDFDKQTLAFADCGHPPLILYNSSRKKCSVHKGNNTPLGVLRTEQIKESTINFHIGDLIFLISDGIIETSSPENEMFGIERFCRFIEFHHHHTPEQFLTLLEKKLADFRGLLKLQDDMTCVCMKILKTGLT